MGHFVYYFPGLTGRPTDEQIHIGRVGYAFEAGPRPQVQVQPGPDGTAGVVTACGDVRVGYFKERQAWRQIYDSNVWLGWEPENLPAPADLARTEQVPGKWLSLGDGNKWICPIARQVIDVHTFDIALPCRMTFKNGDWTRNEPETKYRELWEQTLRLWDAMRRADPGTPTGDNNVTVDIPCDVVHVAVLALQCNYRVGREEVSELGLLSDRTLGRIHETLVDMDALRELLAPAEKKTPAEPSCCDNG